MPTKQARTALSPSLSSALRLIRASRHRLPVVPPQRYKAVLVSGVAFDAAIAPLLGLDLAGKLANIERAIRATGRIAGKGSPGHLGTGFAISDRLIVTNAHVTAGIPAKDLVIDFRCDPATSIRHAVARLAGGHPLFDLAVLELKNPLPPGAPLALAAAPPPLLAERIVVVIGYPQDPAKADFPPDGDTIGQVFGVGTAYGVKRLQPGTLSDVVANKNWRGYMVPTLRHCCSTWNGNSGSPVVDIDSGLVVGIHENGEIKDNAGVVNWSVPSWELPQDTKLAALLRGSFK